MSPYSIRSERMPSCFARRLIASSTTADWLMPRRSESSLSKIVAVSLKRILVFFFVMLTVYHMLWYTASTWKPPAS